jgi:hypothetical protein
MVLAEFSNVKRISAEVIKNRLQIEGFFFIDCFNAMMMMMMMMIRHYF